MNIQQLINAFQNEFGYVEDIESLLLYLEENNIPLSLSIEILHNILEWNNEVEKELKKKIEKKELKKEKIEEEIEEQEESITYEDKKTTISNIENYKKLIDKCEDFDFITEILPSPYENNYNDVIYSLLLTYYQELTLAQQLLKETTEITEKNYLKNEMKRIQEIITIIKNYHKEEIPQETQEENQDVTENNLILYLNNSLQTPYINIDIEDIDISDYPYLETIFKELSQGRISHEKRFNNYEELKGISAIRKGDVRVIFTRIDNNIIILGALAKRFQNPIVYRELLKRRTRKFKEQKEQIKDELKNEQFIENNNSITAELFKKLNPSAEKIKQKKRDKNGTAN